MAHFSPHVFVLVVSEEAYPLHERDTNVRLRFASPIPLDPVSQIRTDRSD